RRIMMQDAFAPFRGDELSLGADVLSDEALLEVVRTQGESAYHPSCTCRMGAVDDATAVLDSACRVKGVESLRVIDSSVFPEITNGNLNAPTIMLAERVADMILGGSLLPPLHNSVWIDERWQHRQRMGEPVRESDVDALI
ncbi:MAG: GMC oxidoreductase, partial [Pseudomonadota bacterium]